MAEGAPKKSLFKRPAWAQKSSSTSIQPDSPAAAASTPATTSLFERPHDFDSAIAERERKRREKAEKKRVKEEKRRSLNDNVQQEDSPVKAQSKRRRISDLDDEKGVRQDGHGLSLRQEEVVAPLKPQNRTSRREKPVIIELGDSEDDDRDEELGTGLVTSLDDAVRTHEQPTRIAAQAKSGNEIPSDSESDPEIAEMKRNARAKRRREEAAERARQNSTDPYSEYATSYPTPPPDPKIQLFITSPIPGATPLVVTRKLSQRLQEVLEAWCGKQTHVPDFDPTQVFLTYRLRKLYNVTTCKSLGIKLDSEGRIIPDRRDWVDDDETGIGGEHEGKVHLEAVTPELWMKLKEDKQNNRKGSSTVKQSADVPTGEDTPMAPEVEAEAEQVIRITMKAKGFKDVKLKVKPSSTFARMANAARHLFNEQAPIGLDQKVTLAFDGEPLEPPEGQIKDTEIEDMDGIEVYIK